MEGLNKLIFVVTVLISLLLISGMDSGAKRVNLKDLDANWTVINDEVEFSVKAKTDGWVCVGFEPVKMMKDSNIIIGFVKDGEALVEDHFGNGLLTHISDTALGGTSDISHIDGWEKDGYTFIRFRLPLDSNDSFDTFLKKGNIYRVVFAYGDKDNFSSLHKYSSTVKIKL